MEVIEAIKTRRSIRKFKNKPVSKEDTEVLIRAAMHAPSAGNKQPWHFIVITDRKKLDQIPEFHPFAEMLNESPLAILICAKVETSEYCDYWVQDCSAATQNLLLAAHAKGLGAVWLGIYPIAERVDGIKQLFNLPPDFVPLSLNAIGYPAEKKEPVDRFDKSRIHYEQW